MIKLFFIVITLLSFIESTSSAQTVKDIDGNFYSIVTIGNQVWLGENLCTTRLNDGSPVQYSPDGKKWSTLSAPAYCWLNNDISYKEVYGALYNWYAVNTGKICPKGWHVPAAREWDELVIYLGGENIAAEKLKEKGDAHWKASFSASTNEFGFTALPGGMRFESGAFPVFGNSYGVWWTRTSYNNSYAWNRGMYFSNGSIFKAHDNMKNGYSVRCIKD